MGRNKIQYNYKVVQFTNRRKTDVEYIKHFIHRDEVCKAFDMSATSVLKMCRGCANIKFNDIVIERVSIPIPIKENLVSSL